MTYQIEFSKKSLKAFLKLPQSMQGNLMKKIQRLADNPYAVNNNIKKLQGEDDCYRLRVGDYRVLYRILTKKLMIEVIHIAHRREAYR